MIENNKNIDIEDWIIDSSTWLQLAEKCELLHVYNLAIDFYNLAMRHDSKVFKKPQLWYRYAKACHRCGLTLDAQIAIKVFFYFFFIINFFFLILQFSFVIKNLFMYLNSITIIIIIVYFIFL
jgi:hypothetical protein